MASRNRFKLEIETTTYIRFFVIVSAFVAVVMVLERLVPVLTILAIAAFLALALNKPVTQLARRMPGKSRILATGSAYLIFVTLLGLFVVLVVPPAVSQTTQLIESLPRLIAQLGSNDSFGAALIQRYHLQAEATAFVQAFQTQAGTFAQGLGSNVLVGLSTVLTGMVTILTILVLTFFMLIEGPGWISYLWQSYTDQARLERHQALVSKMYHVVTGYVNGQVLVAALAGTIASVVLYTLSLFFAMPASMALPLGTVVFLLELLPLIGPGIATVIVAGALAFSDLGASVIFLVFYLIYQQVEANIIQPAVQSRTVEISALTVLISVVTGVVLFGVVGAILAIPIAGCIRVLLLDYIKTRHQQRLSNVGSD